MILVDGFEARPEWIMPQHILSPEYPNEKLYRVEAAEEVGRIESLLSPVVLLSWSW